MRLLGGATYVGGGLRQADEREPEIDGLALRGQLHLQDCVGLLSDAHAFVVPLAGLRGDEPDGRRLGRTQRRRAVFDLQSGLAQRRDDDVRRRHRERARVAGGRHVDGLDVGGVGGRDDGRCARAKLRAHFRQSGGLGRASAQDELIPKLAERRVDELHAAHVGSLGERGEVEVEGNFALGGDGEGFVAEQARAEVGDVEGGGLGERVGDGDGDRLGLADGGVDLDAVDGVGLGDGDLEGVPDVDALVVGEGDRAGVSTALGRREVHPVFFAGSGLDGDRLLARHEVQVAVDLEVDAELARVGHGDLVLQRAARRQLEWDGRLGHRLARDAVQGVCVVLARRRDVEVQASLVLAHPGRLELQHVRQGGLGRHLRRRQSVSTSNTRHITRKRARNDRRHDSIESSAKLMVVFSHSRNRFPKYFKIRMT
eukprot:scaffold123463_cov45-Prasinocladus_malaysianus.AAC.1